MGFRPVLDFETVDDAGKPDIDEINGLYAIPMWLAVTDPTKLDRVAIPLFTEEVREVVRGYLEDPSVVTCWHNGGYDFLSGQNIGITISERWFDTILADWLKDAEGRMGRHSIDDCAEDYFGICCPKFNDVFLNPDIPPVGGGAPTGRISDYSAEVAGDYATTDTYRGALVAQRLEKDLSEDLLNPAQWIGLDPGEEGVGPAGEKVRGRTWDPGGAPIGTMRTTLDYYWKIEEPHLHVLLGMEREGTPIDRPYMEGLSERLTDVEQQGLARLFTHLGEAVNINSGPQLSDLLFNQLGFAPSRKTKTGWSADADSIEACLLQAQEMVTSGEISADDARFQIIGTIVEVKDAVQKRGTFVDGIITRLDARNHIHTHYNPLIRTGRLSSKNPNLQNLPNPVNDQWEIRRGWIAPDGEVLVILDWSQVELRILAAYSGDPLMTSDIEQGRDLHSAAAARGLGVTYEEFNELKKAGDILANTQRQGYKTVRFAQVYGAEDETLAKQMSTAMGRPVSVAEASRFRRGLEDLYPVCTEWILNTHAYAHESEFVSTILGRKRRIPYINYRAPYLQAKGERVAVNTIIQGSAADLMKIVLLTIGTDPVLKAMGYKLRLQVHDEVVGSVPQENAEEARARIVDIMENPFRPIGLEFPLPLTVDDKIVNSWFEAK